MGNLGGGEVGDWGGMGTAGGGHLRLFKQISEEYQSLRTLQEMLLVCSPLPQRHSSPLERPFDHRPKDRKKECSLRRYLRDCSECKSFLANYSSRRHLGRTQLISCRLSAGPLTCV